MGGRDELPERPRFADDRRELVPAVASIRTLSSSKPRGSIVCTTRTPWSNPRSMSGTPRNEWYGSSPASPEYLNRGCVVASATTCGRSCSATSPARPSVSRMRTLADALRTEADRCRQHQLGAIGFEQVDRTDVCRESPLNELDDVREGLCGFPLCETRRLISSSVQRWASCSVVAVVSVTRYGSRQK